MNKKVPFFSIITPAFNSEHFIRRCIDSVIQQDFCDWEMIIANDGSTDGTKQILDEYSSLNNKILVLNLNHNGYCNTMNQLISAVRGQYVLSIDSDNWLDQQNTLSLIFDIIVKTGTDIVQLPYQLIPTYKNGKTKIIPKLADDHFFKNYNDINKGILNKEIYYVCHGGRAIKSELLSGVGFFGNPTGSDSRLMCLLVARSKSYYCESKHFLNVEIRKGSLSNSDSSHTFSFYYEWIRNEIVFFKFYEQLYREEKRSFPQLILFVKMFKKCIYKSSIRQCFQTIKTRMTIWHQRKLFKGTYSFFKLFFFCNLPFFIKILKYCQRLFSSR